jgi:flagellin-specific chaperone FliS
MEDREYYDKLQIMVDKAKDLKTKIDLMVDYEAKGYLKLALETLYTDMRELIKQRDQR